MHKFIMANGDIVFSDTFMKGPCTDGKFYDISRIDEDFTTWLECSKSQDVDPNINYIFGYEEQEFMAKQYK